ncbi:MAG: hypothetical protein IT271_07300, partial [Chitinophagales bacterium]|nr:hypothetical protein [Chitinophagales bacterium]
MRTIWIILISVLFFSCKKEAFVQPEYIIFGAIQGDCADGCRFVYYLDGTKLTEDPTVKYFSTGNLANF